MAASSASDMAWKRGSRALILATVRPERLDLALVGRAEKRFGERTQHEILYIRPEWGQPAKAKDRQIRMAAARET